VNYEFLPEAEAEYLEAIRFYQDQQNRLGALLIEDFERTVNLIIQKPDTWRMVHQSGIRRIGLSHFPYSVFYRNSAGRIVITAFAHHRRRPGYWLSRV
jgi:plasmid stabilization system protein ParE